MTEEDHLEEGRRSVRGAGRDHAGATDVTMLIWKTIEADPGITRDAIFRKVEDRIPAPYALRRYVRYLTSGPAKAKSRSTEDVDLQAARKYITRTVLQRLLGDPTARRQPRVRVITRLDNQVGYETVGPPPRYIGDPDMLDRPWTSGGEDVDRLHLVSALHKAEAVIARVQPKTYVDRRGVTRRTGPRPSSEDWEAIVEYIELSKKLLDG